MMTKGILSPSTFLKVLPPPLVSIFRFFHRMNVSSECFRILFTLYNRKSKARLPCRDLSLSHPLRRMFLECTSVILKEKKRQAFPLRQVLTIPWGAIPHFHLMEKLPSPSVAPLCIAYPVNAYPSLSMPILPT